MIIVIIVWKWPLNFMFKPNYNKLCRDCEKFPRTTTEQICCSREREWSWSVGSICEKCGINVCHAL